MSLSRIARTIGESATLKLNSEAAALREKGEPVIHLGGGEPLGEAPVEARRAAQEVLESGKVRYGPPGGTLALKKAILEYTRQFYGRAAEPANVIASSGAKQALMVCLQAILDPEDEVLYPVPYWVSYPDMIALASGAGVPVPCDGRSFLPRFEEIERRVGPRTRALILNSPNNPSGVVYPEELVAKLVALCESRGLYLIMDDIYHRLIFDGRHPVSAWEHARDRSESSKLVIVNGVSKQYAMTGFRIGWAVGNRALIEAMTRIQSHQTSGPSPLLQAAAVGALSGAQDGVLSLCRTLEASRDLMLLRLGSVPRIHVEKPGGTFFCFPDVSAHATSSVALARLLLEKAKVVTVPGIEFGMEGYLRLSFCGARSDIEEGVERIRWALDPEAPRELRVGERVLMRE